MAVLKHLLEKLGLVRSRLPRALRLTRTGRAILDRPGVKFRFRVLLF
jgi:hypothetical protein